MCSLRRRAESARWALVSVLAVTWALASRSPAFAQSGDWARRDRAIAERFAPVFQQGTVGTRFDFITNFDFDGDWIGDNNWANAGDPTFAQKAYVYYAVSETPTHYFVHYAAFHPRDYKGGELTGALLSQVVRRGAKASTAVRQTSVADDVVLAHENDLEGCLVVAEKRGGRLEDAEIVAVETLAHNRYLRFQREATLSEAVGSFRADGQQPLIYIEPKGHGMEAYADQLQRRPEDAEAPGRAAGGGGAAEARAGAAPSLAERAANLVDGFNRARKAVNLEGAEQIRVYRYTGTADNPEQTTGEVGYDLVPLIETMWTRARGGPNETFGEVQDYRQRDVRVAGERSPRRVALGRLGSSFLGAQGAENKARPPWGWFDMSERNRPLGEWFFDPAGVIQRHFPALTIDAGYLHQPFLGVIRPSD